MENITCGKDEIINEKKTNSEKRKIGAKNYIKMNGKK